MASSFISTLGRNSFANEKNRSATKKILKFFFRSETIALDGLRAWHSQNFAFASAGVGDSWDEGRRICFYVSFFAFLFTIARHTV